MSLHRQRRSAIALSILVALGTTAAFAGSVAASSTFVVNRIGNASDNNLADAKCDTSTSRGKQCTLRAAIQEANDTVGADIINFKITSSSKVITPASPLPPLTERVTIDGYSQTGASPNTLAVGNNAVLKIVLDGRNAGADANGLEIADYSITVKGLVIQRFDGSGILISGTKSRIEGNRIGTNAVGTVARGNGVGVTITGDQNAIGGAAPESRNVVSGNVQAGIKLTGPDAVANFVTGNYVGTTATGGGALGNGDTGVMIAAQAFQNRIGGTSAGARNVIAANGRHGISILGANQNLIQGNLIGTKADGTGDLGNADTGVSVQGSSGNLIGGGIAGSPNLVSGNGGSGIDLYGTASFDNGAQGNVVRLNDEHGIVVSSRRGAIAGNVIFGNAADGIRIFEFPSATANRNRITANQIFGNGGLGIDLVGGTEDSFGVTANDAGDTDFGPNDLHNFPVLTSAIRSNSTGLTTIVGSLNSSASTEFAIELFIAAADSSGHGEGHIFIGDQDITTNSSGNKTFSFVSGQLQVGTPLTATATSFTTTSTSEFSANLTVVPGP